MCAHEAISLSLSLRPVPAFLACPCVRTFGLNVHRSTTDCRTAAGGPPSSILSQSVEPEKVAARKTVQCALSKKRGGRVDASPYKCH